MPRKRCPGAPGFFRQAGARRAFATAGWSILLAFLGAPSFARADIYYVDNGNEACSDSGPGTQAQPYCTISAAVAAHQGPGVTIAVMPGIYRETVAIPASGAAGSPFTIQGQGGGVIVDGADSFASPSLWAPYSGTVFVDAAVTTAPKQVFVDGARLRDTTGTTPAAIPTNSFAWVSGQGLYVNLGGDNPGSHATLVGRRNYAFTLSGVSYVTLQGLHVTHAESRGINLTNNANNCSVVGDQIDFCFHYGMQVNACSGELIAGNTIMDNFDSGVALTGSTSCTVQDNECGRNEVPNAVHAGSGVYLYGSTGNLIQRNRLHDNNDEGLNFASGANNNVSLQNLGWNNADHGFDELGATGNVHIGDVAWHNLYEGFAVDGSATGTVLYDCIGVDNGLTTLKTDLWVDSPSKNGFVSDYNIFWNSTSRPPFKYGSTSYATLAAYSAASGQDAHTLQADPMWVNPAAGDFHLQAGSPAIDSGISSVADWPALDAQGNPRVDDPATPNTGAGNPPFADRGALEFQTDQAPVVTAPGTASVNEGKPLTVNVTALDPDGNAIASLTASGLPAGASFALGPGNTTGTLTWTPGYTQAGTYAVTFTASNALSGSATTTITVNFVDVPPVVSAPPNAGVMEGSLLTVSVGASDPNGDPITSLIASGLPAGASFSPGPGNTTGALTWTPSVGQAGTYAVTFTASNGLSGSATTTITVSPVDAAPVVTAPDTVTVMAGDPVTINVTASDPDGEGISSLSAAGLPAGATFTAGAGNTTGTLSWTPDVTQPGTYDVTFTASNALSGSSTTTIVVTGSTALAVGDVPPGMVPLVPRLAPSPVRSRSTLLFLTTRAGPLEVALYDLGGRRVRELVNDPRSAAGIHRVLFEAEGGGAGTLASGVYFLRIDAVEGTAKRRIVVTR